jgi:hypothetical protein
VPEWIELIEAKELPDRIDELTPDMEVRILKWAIICEESWRPYRIVKAEMEYYKRWWIPLPRKHPDIRHKERMRKRPWRQLYLRICDKCWKEIISVYPEWTSFKVYCEECYNKEMY